MKIDCWYLLDVENISHRLKQLRCYWWRFSSWIWLCLWHWHLINAFRGSGKIKASLCVCVLKAIFQWWFQPTFLFGFIYIFCLQYFEFLEFHFLNNLFSELSKSHNMVTMPPEAYGTLNNQHNLGFHQVGGVPGVIRADGIIMDG